MSRRIHSLASVFDLSGTAKPRGFWFIFESADQMRFERMQGYVILPVHTQMAAAASGFYFGGGGEVKLIAFPAPIVLLSKHACGEADTRIHHQG